MPRPSNKKQRRAEIVEGLMRVMATSGYERASIRQIAQEAGLASGVVHYHFGSKLDILVELADTLHQRVRARMANKGPDSAEKRIYAVIDAHLALGVGSDPTAVAAWAMVGAEAISQPEVREVYAGHLTALRSGLQALFEQAGVSAADAETGSAAMIALFEGAYHVSAAAPDVMPVGYAAAAARHLADAYLSGSHQKSG